MASKIIIRYNGIKADSLSTENTVFTYTDNASGEADSITVSLHNYNGKWLNGFYPVAGDYLKVWIKGYNWGSDKQSESLYCGKFLIDMIRLSGWPQTAELSGISVPIRTSFNVTQRSKSWKNSDTKTILSDLAKDGEIKLVYDAKTYKIKEAGQGGQTDLGYAFSLCSEYGLALKMYNDKMIVYDQTEYEKKKAMYTIKKENLGENGAYNAAMQITNVYDAVKLKYSKGKETLTYSYTVPGKKGTRIMVITEKADSAGEAETKAKARLRENLRSSKSIELKVAGDVRYKAAENFNLSGFGKLDGRYFIDQVVHEKSNSAWTCSIRAHGVVTEF